MQPGAHVTGSVCRFWAAILDTNHRTAKLQGKSNSFMNNTRLQHQSVQIAVVHRGGQDDLGAGGAQLLELQDQVFQLGHAAAAHLTLQ